MDGQEVAEIVPDTLYQVLDALLHSAQEDSAPTDMFVGLERRIQGLERRIQDGSVSLCASAERTFLAWSDDRKERDIAAEQAAYWADQEVRHDRELDGGDTFR